MKYCKKCGKPIQDEIKFCTHCGAPVAIKESQQKVERIDEKVKKPSSMIKKVFIGGIAIVGLFFLAKTFVPEFDDFTNSYTASKALTRLVGKWHDPTGKLLGSSQTFIKFRKMGDALVGEDENKEIYIKLLHYSGNSYGGFVVLRGVDASFEVSYYNNEEKLVFFSTLTKSSWNIRRFK